MAYSYLDAGFSTFLTRSVDDVTASNLDQYEAAGEQSRALNYDASQVGGALGSIWRVGPITINGQAGRITVSTPDGLEVVRIDDKGILVSDANGPRGILGFKDNDFLIGASAQGDDVTSVSDDKRIFSSGFKSQRITKAISDSVSFPASFSGDTTRTYLHGFPYTPLVVGVYWEVFDVDGLVATQHFWINGIGPAGAPEGMSVDKDKISLTFHSDSRSLPGTAYWKVFTYGPNDFSPNLSTNF